MTNMTDWTKYALGRSADKFTNLKDAAFISVGGPNWINPNINAELAKAKAAGRPAIAVYIPEIEIYTQIFNTPTWQNWDQEADPYYSGKGNHNSYLLGMIKGKGFSAIMFDIRNVKGSAEAWIRGVLSYLMQLSVNELGLKKTYLIADHATYQALDKEHTGNTNVYDFLFTKESNGVISFVQTDGDYPAETEHFIFGPAPYIDWWYFADGQFLYVGGSREQLWSDLGFTPSQEEPGETPDDSGNQDDQTNGQDLEDVVSVETLKEIKQTVEDFLQAFIAGCEAILSVLKE